MTETKTVFTGENAALEFDNLDVKFRTEFGTVHAVKGLSLTVEPGEVMALVGESGSGKSVTGFSIMGLVDPPGEIAGGDVGQGHHPGDHFIAFARRGRAGDRHGRGLGVFGADHF